MPILQKALPDLPASADLPGVSPGAPDGWLVQDDAYASQMALRRALIAERPEHVHTLLPEAEAAARELLDAVLLHRNAWKRGAKMLCPDGMAVSIDPADPLLTLGQLVQEDLCILQRRGQAHVLTGAILCFPASWMLQEKIGRSLMAIHRPVRSYTADIERRVTRLFDGVRHERPLMRANALWYDDPALFQPRREDDPRPVGGSDAAYLRVEHQWILRLPETGAVVFAIHTYLRPRAELNANEHAWLNARQAAV